MPASSPADTGPGLTITYPDELPVSQQRDVIARAIAEHQVVVVAGETGSGKTTQLPKICLELGRGSNGAAIGHTQPRRIAARSVAERIAEELNTDLGDVVGFKVRFTDRSSDRTQVKVMTDGILLAELQHDRELRRYDTIIIDEAHERSLNIDFILGYLKQLLPRRPELKVVITSATIDPERFARHFGDAPVIEVSGRVYPVEVRYREPDDDQPSAITDAVRELVAEGPGDILVFLSGEREIRDAADALKRLRPRRPGDEIEVLPLFARLSAAEQHRVFAAHSTRRVVLATNVAETSLTVPGIRYVVDTGLARISRFSARTKVQRLPIEPISQASANQRKGRCGRLADGVCIRLYAEEDFAARPEFTDPEIVRTNLASVILQMTALGLGDVARFPFIDPPDTRSVQAGLQLLEEIGALASPSRRTKGRSRGSGRPRLTSVGRRLARIPLDPRLGRMLVEADRNGCLREVITIAAALSMQDPRERPLDQQEAADAKHRRFADPTSDFAAILNLWRYLKDQQQELSSSGFGRMCRKEFLSYLRVREWQDLDAQLRQVAKQLGLRLNRTPATAEAVHRALLSGLLSHIGMRDPERRDYLGARGSRFAIFPGSALFSKPPDFVMAAELVETGRLWGRVVAKIDPAWAESAAAHLVKRTYAEPHWSKRRGAVLARERVTLYGVPIVADRLVSYGGIDPETSRDLFIRHALVQGEWQTRHEFFARNQRLVADAEALEDRARRRDIVVDEQSLVDFYDQRVPSDVVSVAHFDAWWKRARREDPHLLDFSLDMLVNPTAASVSTEDYPETWRSPEAELALRYAFEPGSDVDGVTVDVPLDGLAQLDPADFTWPVPGLREELVTALIRSLPKQLRVKFVPAPDVARSFLASTEPGAEPLLEALERYLRRTTGEHVPRDAWNLDRLPPHLRMSFRVLDDSGAEVARGKDLAALQRDLTAQVHSAVAASGSAVERTGITRWDVDEVPRHLVQTRAGRQVKGFPALVDEGTSVALRVLPTEADQAAAMPLGLRRLLILTVEPPGKDLLAELGNEERLQLALAPHAHAGALLDDCFACAVDAIVDEAGGPAWTRGDFDVLAGRVRECGRARTREVLELVRRALLAAQPVQRRLSGRAELTLLPALTDLQEQLSGLLHPGFAADTGLGMLAHLPRYLAAMQARLDDLAADPRKDAVRMAQVHEVLRPYQDRVATLAPGRRPSPRLREVGWMIEELRVSLWAQRLGTSRPVSVPRIQKLLAAT